MAGATDKATRAALICGRWYANRLAVDPRATPVPRASLPRREIRAAQARAERVFFRVAAQALLAQAITRVIAIGPHGPRHLLANASI